MKITLIGSAKSEEDFVKANKELTLFGHVIYLPIFDKKNELTGTQKVMAEMVHYRKISESDKVVLIDREEVIDESTYTQISCAVVFQKPIISAKALEFDWLKINESIIL